MKFKKKAARVAMLLSFKEKAGGTRSFLKENKKLDLEVQQRELKKNIKESKTLEIRQEEKRFDRISGNKEMYFARTLNFLYIDNSPMTLWFTYSSNSANTVHVRLTMTPLPSIFGVFGKKIEIALYE